MPAEITLARLSNDNLLMLFCCRPIVLLYLIEAGGWGCGVVVVVGS